MTMMLLNDDALPNYAAKKSVNPMRRRCSVWRAYAGLGDGTVVPAHHHRAGWRRLRCRWTGAAVR
jgi:hypothetical protein